MLKNELIKKDSYVEIKILLLKPEERIEGIPEDTSKVPFEARIKGFLVKDAYIGEKVEIITALKRVVSGILIAVNPPFKHDFGEPVRELLEIGWEVDELWKQ
ncbi:MAG: 2-amino-4-ketopentanoate thiolase alpha subunit [candidate division WS2 bacterium]|nr:2-amino-4-ketopentanoate thiolase alpha subunit [Candidatus Lithacetigena glycinireducens]MBT9174982.1 2-amino-4-ketopentanoate thiolase alpha subunit [Candidatus Lithacetigena glycinireducens]